MCQIRTGMDLTFGAEHEAFRNEARSWLAEHVPSESLPSLQTAAGLRAHRAWEATMFADRWTAVSWPVEYGGRGLGVMEWLVFEEEYHRFRAPERVSRDGISHVAPRIFQHGTAEQKDRFLTPIAASREIWCQSSPGPEAGSDPGADPLAVRDPKGERWILNSRTMWARDGAVAQWCLGLFLTDPGAGRHGRWTCFLIALDAPGVTVRPVRQMDGGTGLAEISLKNVEVPDIQVLGPVGSGWSVAMSDPGNQHVVGLRSPDRVCEDAARLIDLFHERGAPSTAVDAVGHAYIDAQAFALHTYWTASKMSLGQLAGSGATCHEILHSVTTKAIRETAMELVGADGELLESGSIGEWLRGYRRPEYRTLSAIANEIQYNVVAEQLLGLPED